MSWGMVGIALIGYLAVLVAVALMRAVPVRSRAVQRLRAFFPSWRFFDDVGHVPLLLVRTGPSEDALGRWQRGLGTAPRRWNAIVLNPEANLQLAYGSLLSQLVADIEEMPESDDVEELVSYQLTHRLVRARHPMPGGIYYQFRVALVTPAAEPTDDDDILVSQVYEA
jgi:hypothetical protein